MKPRGVISFLPYAVFLLLAALFAPAYASISIIGPTERSNGKFQGTMFPTTPFGWGITNALPDPKRAVSSSRASFIISSWVRLTTSAELRTVAP